VVEEKLPNGAPGYQEVIALYTRKRRERKQLQQVVKTWRVIAAAAAAVSSALINNLT
jgi:anti-sigma-K factor RskA